MADDSESPSLPPSPSPSQDSRKMTRRLREPEAKTDVIHDPPQDDDDPMHTSSDSQPDKASFSTHPTNHLPQVMMTEQSSGSDADGDTRSPTFDTSRDPSLSSPASASGKRTRTPHNDESQDVDIDVDSSADEDDPQDPPDGDSRRSHTLPSSSADASSTPPPPHRARKRVRQILTQEQSAVLNAILVKTHFPSTSVREAAAKQLGVSPRKVQVWFQNVRQKEKKKATMAAAAATKPIEAGGKMSPSSPLRNIRVDERPTGAALTNRQHVVPTSPVYKGPPVMLHGQGRVYAGEGANAGYMHQPGLPSPDIDHALAARSRRSSLINAAVPPQPHHHSLIRVSSDHTGRPYSAGTEPVLGTGNHSGLGLTSMDFASQRRLPQTSAMGRHRSASDATSRYQWHPPHDLTPSDDPPRPSPTRVPVYRMAARPLMHQLPETTRSDSRSMGHRHTRSNLQGLSAHHQHMYHRSAAPYWTQQHPAASAVHSNASDPHLHHARSLSTMPPRVVYGQGDGPAAHSATFGQSQEKETSPMQASREWSMDVNTPGSDVDHQHPYYARFAHVSSQRSQPQLRTVQRTRSIQSVLHRARSDCGGLPPLLNLPSPDAAAGLAPLYGLGFANTKYRPSSYATSPTTSTSSASSSQMSLYGGMESEQPPRQHVYYPLHLHRESLPPLQTRSGSGAGSFGASRTSSDRYDGSSPISPDTPEEEEGSIRLATRRAPWSSESGVAQPQQQQTPFPRRMDVSAETEMSLSTPTASTFAEADSSTTGASSSGSQSRAQAFLSSPPKPALRVNPWRVRGGSGGTSSAGLASTPFQWQSSADAGGPSLRQPLQHHPQPLRPRGSTISQLSSRLEGIMSEGGERRVAPGDGEISLESLPPVHTDTSTSTASSTSTPDAGATSPSSGPLHARRVRVGYEVAMRLSAHPRSDNERQGEGVGDHPSSSSLDDDQPTFDSTQDDASTVDSSHMDSADVTDGRMHLPPIRSPQLDALEKMEEGLQQEQQGDAVGDTEKDGQQGQGQGQRLRSASMVRLPSIRNLQLGV